MSFLIIHDVELDFLFFNLISVAYIGSEKATANQPFAKLQLFMTSSRWWKPAKNTE